MNLLFQATSLFEVSHSLTAADLSLKNLIRKKCVWKESLSKILYFSKKNVTIWLDTKIKDRTISILPLNLNEL